MKFAFLLFIISVGLTPPPPTFLLPLIFMFIVPRFQVLRCGGIRKVEEVVSSLTTAL